MVLALLANKVFAYFLGPAGLAVIGQIQNILQITGAIGQGGINTGVIKLVATEKHSEFTLSKIYKNSVYVTLIFSVFTSILIYFYSNKIIWHLAIEQKYEIFIRLAPIYVIFSALYLLYISFLTGLEKTKIWFRFNVCQSLTVSVLSVTLCFFYGLEGVLWAVCIAPLIYCVLATVMVWDRGIIKKKFRSCSFNWEIISQLVPFSFVTIVSGVASPLVQSAVRTDIIVEQGLEAGGHWQAIIYVSLMTNLLLVSMITLYFIPRVSSNKSVYELQKTIVYTLSIIFLVLTLTLIIFMYFGGAIFTIIFSYEFFDAGTLMYKYVIGDFFRMLGWVFATLYLLKGNPYINGAAEILFGATLVFFSNIFVRELGIDGAIMAYTLNSSLYFIVFFLFSYRFYTNKDLSDK